MIPFSFMFNLIIIQRFQFAKYRPIYGLFI